MVRTMAFESLVLTSNKEKKEFTLEWDLGKFFKEILNVLSYWFLEGPTGAPKRPPMGMFR